MKFKTADICDEYQEKISVAEPTGFRNFGGRKSFYGKIQTVKCYEDNSLVKKALETKGEGKILVIDGGGSKRCALMGDMLGELAVKNNWNGIIISGCIRDSIELGNLDLGVKALDTNPLKSRKNNEGRENIPVRFAGVFFNPGEFVYCDEDGIIVSKDEIL